MKILVSILLRAAVYAIGGSLAGMVGVLFDYTDALNVRQVLDAIWGGAAGGVAGMALYNGARWLWLLSDELYEQARAQRFEKEWGQYCAPTQNSAATHNRLG